MRHPSATHSHREDLIAAERTVGRGRYRQHRATSPAYTGEGPGGERFIAATAELACLNGSDHPPETSLGFRTPTAPLCHPLQASGA